MHSGVWPTLELQGYERSFKELQHLVDEQASVGGDDVVAQLARLLVVRACGYVEQVAEQCCKAYLLAKSDPRSAAFGSSWLGTGRNPSPGKLVDLVRRLDPEWAVELSGILDDNDEELRRELKFLVDRRNRIAHGENEGIGARRALDLSAAAELISDWFVLRLDPR